MGRRSRTSLDAVERSWAIALMRKDKERPGVSLAEIMVTVVDCQFCLDELKEERSVVWRRSLKGLTKKLKQQAAEFDRRAQEMEKMVRKEMRRNERIQSHTGGG